MFNPFFLFVGHRYTRIKCKNHFISFISLTSMIGIALGVTVLITVISVMNGFSKEIRAQMLTVAPHVTLRGYDGKLHDWQPVFTDILKQPLVKGAAPFIAAHGMLIDRNQVEPVVVRGVQPQAINAVYPLENNIIAGSLQALQAGKYGVVLGKEMANNLGVWLGDKLNLIVPEINVSLIGITPRMKRFTIIAIFDSGTTYDRRHAFINLQDASRVYRMHDAISGIQIRTIDEMYAHTVAQKINEKFAFKYHVSDWTQEYGDFFEAIKMEKTVMWCILLLIIAVAVFNLVSTLVMIVTDKRADIAIMRTMGASSKTIMGIFTIQGGIIGIIGTLLGLIFGLILAHNVTAIVEFIQRLFNTKFISENIYFIGYVPSSIHTADVVAICLCSLFMSFLATIYPAWRAVNVQPAEALRYE